MMRGIELAGAGGGGVVLGSAGCAPASGCPVAKWLDGPVRAIVPAMSVTATRARDCVPPAGTLELVPAG